MYMDHLKDLRQKKNMHQLLLFIVFLIYLIFGVETPKNLANMIDTPYGMIIIILISIALFCVTNPILGFTGFVVAYELIRRAGKSSGNQALQQYVTTESVKSGQMRSFNNDVNNNKLYSSLEEQVVSNMVPYTNQSTLETSNVKPVLDN